ncbi:MAG TPA: hypothetical protein PLA54_09335 [Spirochaetota bacterium]|nr:hypothetical protein [Spirochaetota bacterium]
MYGADDLKWMFQDFGEKDARYISKSGDSIPIELLFDRKWGEEQAGRKIDSSEIVATCISSQIDSAVKGEKISVRGKDYFIERKPQPDGAGLTLIFLSEDEPE